MHEQPHTPPRSNAAYPTEHVEPQVNPSSSRMLATYLADVERMLEEKRWDLALRDAVDLPSIAVALTDPHMKSSPERCREWCKKWIQPANVLPDPAVAPEQLGQMLSEHDTAPATERIPAAALRRLRLRRHARNSPRGFKAARMNVDDRDAADALDLCTAVVAGVRRWYAHCACHDATAQANLARLAVLR